jgi:hypothetical protein
MHREINCLVIEKIAEYMYALPSEYTDVVLDNLPRHSIELQHFIDLGIDIPLFVVLSPPGGKQRKDEPWIQRMMSRRRGGDIAGPQARVNTFVQKVSPNLQQMEFDNPEIRFQHLVIPPELGQDGVSLLLADAIGLRRQMAQKLDRKHFGFSDTAYDYALRHVSEKPGFFETHLRPMSRLTLPEFYLKELLHRVKPGALKDFQEKYRSLPSLLKMTAACSI